MRRTIAAIAASFRDGRSARRHLLDAELEALAPLMRGRVLEIGNGQERRRGAFVPPFPQVDAWIFVDLDLARAPHACADAQALPFSEGAFDTVVCFEVLEYVARPDGALQEMCRVLQREGVLIVSAPFNTRPDTTTDLWRFTANGLRHLAASTGLEVTRISTQGAIVATMLHLFRSLNTGANLRRRIVAWLTTPAFRLLLTFDRSKSLVTGAMGGYTTGYVLVARKQDSLP